MIPAVTALLACQLLGEVAARALHLPVPGPVVGMVLLFAALLARRRAAPPELGRAADGLLDNLGLLFVPAGVGVVLHLPLLARDWAPLTLAVVAGTLAAIAATGRLAQWLLRRGRGGA
ncbi:CidA/LrgA family protein [Falsiroseomonas sp. CW058]|uniref:CidA/LrgA family protein n=1 Tax=Falsiroseomonas sp. CW058 TaxID=3388664 RepID=UPI003D3103A5